LIPHIREGFDFAEYFLLLLNQLHTVPLSECFRN
jgi:hypothetical protein